MKPGSRVRANTMDEEVEGLLMESEDDKFLVVKLDNGYNIGIKRKRVKDLKKLKGPENQKKSKAKQKKSKAKTKITILHTGGTIASRVDYKTGAVVGQFDPSEILEMFPELNEIANVDSRLIRNIMSEMMRFEHYNLLAEEIKKEADKGADGIIITHGTDTLHYSSAALSFALENLNIPVLMVGSQRSSDRPSTDSYMNLMCAAEFIANTDFAGVAVCMHESMDDNTCIVMHGCKTRKMHTSRRDAFRPINTTPIARVSHEEKKIEYLGEYEKQQRNDKLEIRKFDPNLKVGILKIHTHMYAEEFDAYKDFDGLVLELTGLGHAPNIMQDEYMKENEKIGKAIQRLSMKMPVVASTQTLYGRVNMHVYSPQRKLMNQGVTGSGHDMTPETAFIKLAWLLSNYKDQDEIKKLFVKNLRGEMSVRLEKNTYLV